MNIIFLNIHGDFKNKMRRYSPFQHFLATYHTDVIGCCETKLKAQTTNTETEHSIITFQPSYYRASSQMKPSNGMCTFIHKRLVNSIRINEYASEHITTVIMKDIPLVVIFVYIPSTDRINEEYIDKTLMELVQLIELFQHMSYAILIMGDLNARMKETGDTVQNATGQRVIEICKKQLLCILNSIHCKGQRTFHANKAKNEAASIVDYAIRSQHELWEQVKIEMNVINEYTGSDHFPIRCRLQSGDQIQIRRSIVKIPFRVSVRRNDEMVRKTAEDFGRNLMKVLDTKDDRKKPKPNDTGQKIKDLICEYNQIQNEILENEIKMILHKVQIAYNKNEPHNVYKIIKGLDPVRTFSLHDERGKIVIDEKEKMKIIQRYYSELYSKDEEEVKEQQSNLYLFKNPFIIELSAKPQAKLTTLLTQTSKTNKL
ncbi:hypothetical protein RFI_02751 [Reticulomyxa filosa]|uniref:Endonuclease/exonuclease/phosphatase domain-containing protein n=1 Tax=Reticulomyxa filosa TaxID=46433 RepID=X6P832_RETFI|nr:hypothetical protein RFI_02751 [Reticulomyxa filosa]|eukprot:ETO34341.1 hypothetical protein RFI_02751 [Reticulomyxa filosa]